jgi:peptidoglycan/xylan/chitin deacetylase (PgdA/CDA1 family)
MKNIDVTIAIDDIHPESGWGMPGDSCMNYLEELNKEFGAKFTLFIPSNYHSKFPLSQHKDWIDWLKSKGYFELAAHGHYHMCHRIGMGECEFYELNTEDDVKSRIQRMMNEWQSVNHTPTGWRNPGWLATPESVKWLGQQFKYAAVHYEHNHNLQWDCKMIFGADGIHKTEILLHDGRIMFQSHIAGNHNDNVWNDYNYEQFRKSLEFINHNYKVHNKFLMEL